MLVMLAAWFLKGRVIEKLKEQQTDVHDRNLTDSKNIKT
jgi:hypothetical protein